VEEIAQQIKASFLDYVEKLDWLDSSARSELTKQVKVTIIFNEN